MFSCEPYHLLLSEGRSVRMSSIVSGVSSPVFTCWGLFPLHIVSMCKLVVGHLSHFGFSDTVLGNMYVLFLERVQIN